MIKVLHADAQVMFVECLKKCFDNDEFKAFQQVEGVYRGDLLIPAIESYKPHILLLALNLPYKDGLSLLPEIRTAYPKLRILVLTHYIEPKVLRAVMRAGADGYLLKANHLDQLIIAMNELLSGNVFVDDKIKLNQFSEKNDEAQFEDGFLLKWNLTPRELEVLKLIAESHTNREIGEKLYISTQTVSVHRKNLMKKMKVHDTAALIRKALRYHLVSIS